MREDGMETGCTSANHSHDASYVDGVDGLDYRLPDKRLNVSTCQANSVSKAAGSLTA